MNQANLGLAMPALQGIMSPSAGELSLEERIGEGGRRVVYQHGSLAIKVNRGCISVRVGSYKAPLPGWFYSLYRTGMSNFNSAEFYNYKKIQELVPPNLANSFMRIYGLVQIDGVTLEVCELVSDYNGKVSKNLQNNGPISDVKFWERLAQLKHFFVANRIPFFDLNPRNIIVRRVADDTSLPVIVDYDQLGYYPYAMQLNLLPQGILRRRIHKRFDFIENTYRISTPSGTSPDH